MAERGFTAEFITELKQLLDNINESINYLELRAVAMGISPYAMKHTDGSLAMERMLLAKAHVMHTMVLLKTDPDFLRRQRATWLNEGI